MIVSAFDILTVCGRNHSLLAVVRSICVPYQAPPPMIKCVLVCVCLCVVITFSRLGINRVWLPILLWSAEQGGGKSLSSPFPLESLVSRVRFGRPIPRQPAHSSHPGWIWCFLTGLHFPFPLRFSLEPSYTIGLVPSLSSHAFTLTMAFTTKNPPA